MVVGAQSFAKILHKVARSIYDKIINSASVNFSVILISLVFALYLSSCSDKSNQIPSNTFKYNLAVGLNSLDPAFAKDMAASWACGHIYEGLFILDSNAELEPLLADSFWIEANQLRYHFHLKKGVYFHKNP